MYRRTAIAVLILLIGSSLRHEISAQASDPSLLSIDRIFASEEFDFKTPGTVRWLKSGDAYTKVEPSASVKDGSDLVSYDAQTNRRSILIPAEKLIPQGQTAPLRIQGYVWSNDDSRVLIFTSSKKVWRLNTRGDYWVLDMASGKLTKLGGDAKPSTLMFAKFSPDGKRVGYVRENNIYVENPDTGKIIQLTTNGSPTMINGTSDWVNEEEFNLRDCWRWSPDSKSIAYWQFNAEGIKNFILINNTEDLYPNLTYIPYPKAGTMNSAVRVGVVSADGGNTTWINTPGDPRNNYIVMLEWTNDPNEVILQHMNRLQNTDQVMLADARTGAVKTILTEKDDAWVELHMPSMRWLQQGKSFLWMSERDGWQHVYTVSRDGMNVKLITPGNFDVLSISGVDEPGGWLYYIASPSNAGQRYLFRSRLDGSGAAEQVTPESQKGWHNYNVSPNNRWAIHAYSGFTSVPKFELVNVATRSTVRPMVDNADIQAKVDRLNKGPLEFFKVDIGNGVMLDTWMMKPPGFDPRAKYPILFYVYGEPAGQTVIDTWTSSSYLWHLMLTQQGYIIASVDNRGTPAPRGRAWRKDIYRKGTVVYSRDQADAAKSILGKMPFIDSARVGIWGWSGGGSSTLNAMFRFPDIYQVGMAVAPVPDIRLYDTIYTERYMGLPQDNAEDYKQASPLTFAKGLKGDLLIVHGTGDDNVHYQGTELLINELIKENKPFTMMAYPNRTHAIFEGENTTRHLYSLLTRYLTEHLPAGKAVVAGGH
jgi:dipeptidyl-peptidase 4